MKTFQHQPVLLESVLRVLAPKIGETYLDGTAGFGGHATAVIDQIGTQGQAILVDRDVYAIEQLQQRFGESARIIHADFLEGAQELLEEGVQSDMILRSAASICRPEPPPPLVICPRSREDAAQV